MPHKSSDNGAPLNMPADKLRRLFLLSCLTQQQRINRERRAEKTDRKTLRTEKNTSRVRSNPHENPVVALPQAGRVAQGKISKQSISSQSVNAASYPLQCEELAINLTYRVAAVKIDQCRSGHPLSYIEKSLAVTMSSLTGLLDSWRCRKGPLARSISDCRLGS